jgi:regulator of RNase E activity RraB
MSIRNIHLRKINEYKKVLEKAELNGIPLASVVKEAKYMNEEEQKVWRAEQIAAAEAAGSTKTDEQIILELAESDRLEYGRYWIWETYFSDKNREKWLQCAEDLKHVNDHVIQDIEDFILLEAFKGQKPNQIEKLIDADHKERIGNTKKLMPKDGEEYEANALNDMKKRRFMNEIRPPMYWNFFEDGPEMSRVQHVLRHNAKPAECYSDGRIEKILQAIEEIGMSLQSYEEQKWAMLRKRTVDIFI